MVRSFAYCFSWMNRRPLKFIGMRYFKEKIKLYVVKWPFMLILSLLKSYMVYRTAPFSMTLNSPTPTFQGQAILWRWISAKWLQIGCRYSHSHYGRRIGNRTKAFKRYHFQWSWATFNPHFKVTIIFNVKLISTLLVHCWYSLGRPVTIGTPMVIFAVLTVFWLFLTIGTLLAYQSSHVYTKSRVRRPRTPNTQSLYRSSIDTVALNCLVFEKIAFLHFRGRQTDKQMDSCDAWSRSLTIASCGLIIAVTKPPQN